MGERTAQQVLDELRKTLTRPRSSQLWFQVLDLLAVLEEEALDEALRVVKPVVLKWPANLRRISTWSPETDWVKRLFEGDVDPRLELVGYADIQHEKNFEEPDLCGGLNYKDLVYPILKVFVQTVAPDFNPPDTVLETKSEYTAAAGCGGGFDEEKRGDGTRGYTWYDKIDESPSGTDPSDGDWTPYGLESGFKFSIGRYLRDVGYYKFAISGPAPKVFELAYAWGMLLREGNATTERARTAIAACQNLWG